MKTKVKKEMLWSKMINNSTMWAKKKDISEVCEFGFGPGIVLGKHEDMPVRIPQKPNNRHNKNVLVIGSPKYGRNHSYIVPNIFTAVRGGESIIATDLKGKLSIAMTPYLISKGYNVKVLNLIELLKSDKKNFLDEIRTPFDADIFAQTVIATTERDLRKKKNSFWDKVERFFLKALLLYVCYDETGKRKNGTIGEIYDLVSTNNKEAIIQKFEQLPRHHPAYSPYTISKLAGGNIWGDVLIRIKTRLQAFQLEVIRNATDKSEIDLELPGKQKCAYFCILSDTDSTFNYLASVFFTFTFVRLIEQASANKTGKLHIPVKILLDEFVNIASILDIKKELIIAPNCGIEYHIIIENLSQLIRVYGKDSWQTIGECCSNIVAFDTNDDLTEKYIKRQLNQPFMCINSIKYMPANSCIVVLTNPGNKKRIPAILHTLSYAEFPESKKLILFNSSKIFP